MNLRHAVIFLSITTACFAASSLYFYAELTTERARTTSEATLRPASSVKLKTERTALTTANEGRVLPPTTDDTIPRPALDSPKIGFVGEPAALTPKQMETFRKARKYSLQNQYADLLRDLKLSREDADRLVDLFVDSESNLVDLSRQGGDPAAVTAELKTQLDNDLLGLLGPSKLARYEEYKQHEEEHVSLSQFRMQLAGAGKPVPTEDQEKRLLAAFIEEKAALPTPQRQPSQSEMEYIRELAKWNEQYLRRRLTRAEGILSADQIASFRNWMEMQVTLHQQALAEPDEP